MPNPIPYPAFNGNCAQAVRFYERALGGKLDRRAIDESNRIRW